MKERKIVLDIHLLNLHGAHFGWILFENEQTGVLQQFLTADEIFGLAMFILQRAAAVAGWQNIV